MTKDNARRFRIVTDECYLNPFDDWDCMPRLYSFHRNFRVSNRDIMGSGRYGNALQELLTEVPDVGAYVPVYLYDHSGRTVKTTPFNCPWDSGLAGFLFVTKQEIRDWRGCQRVGKIVVKREVEILESQVKLLDNILTGQVFGFQVEENGEEVDSCYGFYGEDIEGIAGHVDVPKDKIEEAFDNVGDWVNL